MQPFRHVGKQSTADSHGMGLDHMLLIGDQRQERESLV